MVSAIPAAIPFDDHAIGVVSGSGLDLRPILDEIYDEQSFAAVAGIVGNGIAGHAGVFIRGTCHGVPVVLQSGRIHLYEGHDPQRIISTVDALHKFGVRKLVLTNAVGGLDGALAPGSLVSANRVEMWPYQPQQFPPPLNPDFVVPGCDAEGMYMWTHGPCYETRAEIEALRRMGALTVGMSLPLEIKRAMDLGIATGVVSCVTNDCTNHDEKLTHEHVVETATRASRRLAGLLRGFIGAMNNVSP